MLTGYALAIGSRENIECYAAGLTSASTLDRVTFPCSAGENGQLLGIEWAIPCSTNGITVTGFNYSKAINSTKPRADAVKTIIIQDNTKPAGFYERIIVVDAYTIADYAACTAIADVTIPAPIIFTGESTTAVPTIPAPVYKGSFIVPVLTLTTFTATAYGFDANGVAIVFAPTTATGTSVALLAAAMQTNWASEMGSGTFVATGQVIAWTATINATLGMVITQA